MAWISTSFQSQTLHMPVEAELLVPQANYKDTGDTCYKVIVLLHGLHNDRTEWLLKSDISDWIKTEPILVFMPSGKNSFFINTFNGYPYMDFITHEVPEFIKTHFHVSHDKCDWLIAGDSMGGYGAMINGLNAPQIYGNIAGFSGAYSIDRIMIHQDDDRYNLIFGDDVEKVTNSNINPFWQCDQLPPHMRPRIFMCCGKQDFLYESSNAMYEKLKDHYDVVYYQEDGEHNFRFWNTMIGNMLKWFREVEQ